MSLQDVTLKNDIALLLIMSFRISIFHCLNEQRFKKGGWLFFSSSLVEIKGIAAMAAKWRKKFKFVASPYLSRRHEQFKGMPT